jgi:hypothetical protein
MKIHFIPGFKALSFSSRSLPFIPGMTTSVSGWDALGPHGLNGAADGQYNELFSASI